MANSKNITPPKEKVCILGSGNWGSAIATVVGTNCQRLDYCDSDVNMWVFEEKVPDERNNNQLANLSEIINTRHENVKYLKGIQLPNNIIAVPDVRKACENATLIIFVLPHQFLPPLLKQVKDVIHPSCRGVSLIKGMDYDPKTNRPVLISRTIEKAFNDNDGTSTGTVTRGERIPFSCGVLMGANVANEVAKGQICESTLASNFRDPAMNERTRRIFDSPSLRVQHIHDVEGAEASGALKNIIALGAGFVDGLEIGSNTKAALLRVGLLEMKRFCQMFFSGVEDATFLESCGMADLITTCYGGRNRKCAEAYAKKRKEGESGSGSGLWDSQRCNDLWESIEKELLNGQKLQGTLACKEVYMVLSSRNLLSQFPLIKTIHEIAFQGVQADRIVDGIVVNSGSASGSCLSSKL